MLLGKLNCVGVILVLYVVDLNVWGLKIVTLILWCYYVNSETIKV
jgi:hypothetical protein